MCSFWHILTLLWKYHLVLFGVLKLNTPGDSRLGSRLWCGSLDISLDGLLSFHHLRSCRFLRWMSSRAAAATASAAAEPPLRSL